MLDVAGAPATVAGPLRAQDAASTTPMAPAATARLP
jgi:hypothetical protein